MVLFVLQHSHSLQGHLLKLQDVTFDIQLYFHFGINILKRGEFNSPSLSPSPLHSTLNLNPGQDISDVMCMKSNLVLKPHFNDS